MKVFVVRFCGVNYISPYVKEEFSITVGVFASKKAAEDAIASGACGIADENSGHSIEAFEVQG